ncbi:MAG: MMPL family transporter [Candidatus Omnitrophota bacterium]
MDKFINKLINFVSKYSLSIIVITCLFASLALIFIPRIKLDHSMDAFFYKKGEDYISYQIWKNEFGNDRFIVLGFSDRGIFTEENLNLISRLSQRLESLEYVNSVTSLTTVNDIIGTEGDFIVRPLIEEIPKGAKELSLLKEQALKNPLYLGDIISKDAKTAGIIIELEDFRKVDQYKSTEAVKQIQRILKEEFAYTRNYYLSGPKVIEFFYTSYMRGDLKLFLPLSLALIVAILSFSLRSLKGSLFSSFSILISLLGTLFFFYISGYAFNNVTIVIPPIILAIVVADSIHFVGEGLHIKRSCLCDQGGPALSESMRRLFIPCLLTSLTTCAGFLSLMVSKVSPIKELGLVVGIGVFFAFVVTFTFLAALMKQFNLFAPLKREEIKELRNSEKTANSISNFDKFIYNLGKFSVKNKFIIFGATVILILLSLAGLMMVNVDTNVLDHFKKKSFIYQSTKFIEDNLSGTEFLNISLKAKSQDYFKGPEILEKIDRLQRFVEQIPQVDKTTSVADYLKDINKSFNNEDDNFYRIPESKRLVSQYLLLYGARDMDDYIDSKWQWATVRARIAEHSTSRLKGIIIEIRGYIKRNFPSNIEAQVLGWPVLEVESMELVVKGQLQSLGLAILIIFMMMFIVFRSFSVGFVSIIPNILPILINFGAMGICGIRLDTATSIISAIGIGIIVDDTIHFLHCFGRQVKKDNDYEKAIHRTFALKGRPIIYTSVILFFGFGVVAFSNFVPTIYFGILSASMMATALLADLIVLPALLLVFKPRFK